MLFNIEIAQTYSKDVYVKSESFYKSFLKSYEEAVSYICDNKLKHEFIARLERIYDETSDQNWHNRQGFSRALDGINM